MHRMRAHALASCFGLERRIMTTSTDVLRCTVVRLHQTTLESEQRRSFEQRFVIRVFCMAWSSQLLHGSRAGLRTTRIWTTVFPGAFSWEDTYKQEEILGTLLPSRPKLRKTQIPRALTKLMASRIRHAYNAFNGDILHVWAMRPIE